LLAALACQRNKVYPNIRAVQSHIGQFLDILLMAKKSARGRPTIPDEEKRKGRFLIKLSDAEYEQIRQAAGEKLTTWAREVLLRAAKRR
jgi:hypothetical protein